MINKENKSDVIISAISALFYSILFSVFYLGEKSIVIISIYAIFSIIISGLIARDIKSRRED
jgi:hypothetical protein